jgi:hypothetical protein
MCIIQTNMCVLCEQQYDYESYYWNFVQIFPFPSKINTVLERKSNIMNL